jgi:hypothetical protein
VLEITRVERKPKRRNTKKGPGSRRRLARKYRGMLRNRLEKILLGSSMIMLAIVSEKRWYKAYLECFIITGRDAYKGII